MNIICGMCLILSRAFSYDVWQGITKPLGFLVNSWYEPLHHSYFIVINVVPLFRI